MGFHRVQFFFYFFYLVLLLRADKAVHYSYAEGHGVDEVKRLKIVLIF